MNPLTQVRNTQRISRQEVVDGVSGKASWHDQFRHSAYVYAGGLPYQLTEGDVLAVFSQYGQIVDVNLPKDKETGKTRGFAFLCYEDQRSTVLCVDNLNGAKVGGRIVRVEHVGDYRKKKKELGVEEAEPNEEVEVEARAQGGTDATSAGRGGGGGGGSFPWETRDSVFSILAEAREDVFGSEKGNKGVEEGADEGKRRRKRKHKHRHKHRHRHRREGGGRASPSDTDD